MMLAQSQIDSQLELCGKCQDMSLLSEWEYESTHKLAKEGRICNRNTLIFSIFYI